MPEARDCPPWCVTDHGKYAGFHGSGRVSVEAPQYHRVSVRALQHSTDRLASVQVLAAGMVQVPCGDAEDLAAIIEQLAGATPEQHRELAAAIRAAAAQITEASGG